MLKLSDKPLKTKTFNLKIDVFLAMYFFFGDIFRFYSMAVSFQESICSRFLEPETFAIFSGNISKLDDDKPNLYEWEKRLEITKPPSTTKLVGFGVPGSCYHRNSR